MGISVSTDSWIQQHLEELATKVFPSSDKFYKNIISSASNSSEILVLEPFIFKNLLKAPGSNLTNLLASCLECLNPSDEQLMINSATLLIRIIPFLLKNNSPINFFDFLLNKQAIFNTDITPITLFIDTLNFCLVKINELKEKEQIVEETESYLPIFDLVCLSNSLLVKLYNKKDICGMIVQTIFKNQSLVSFLNYINNSGRNPSVLYIVILLMINKNNEIKRIVDDYLKRCNLSEKLCTLNNDLNDEFCLLCSFSFHDNGFPSLNTDNIRVIQLALFKIFLNDSLNYDINDIIEASKISNSNMYIYIIKKFHIQTQEQAIFHFDFELSDFEETEGYSIWLIDTISNLYLYNMNYILKGTDIDIELPKYQLEQFIPKNL